MKKIEGEAKSIRKLLSNSRFFIDYYQREYKWQTKHVKELLEDLSEKFLESYNPNDERVQIQSYENYFLGSIILCEKNNNRFIIDGQQRLTTLTLLLIYLRNREENERQRSKLMNLIFSDVYGKESFNIDVAERNPYLNRLLNDEDIELNGKAESISNIISRYADIEKYFPEEIPQNAITYFSDWLLENVFLVEITAHTDEDAYSIFETMNDRGLSLKPLDMLKGYLLANISDEQKRNVAAETWKSMIIKIKEVVKDEEADAFKAWLRSQYAQTIRERKRNAKPLDFDLIGTEFHRWVRDNNEQIGIKRSCDFYDFINENMTFYAGQYVRIRVASEFLTPGLEKIFFNSRYAFTLQYPLLLAPLLQTDTEDVIIKKLNLVSTFVDISIARRIWNFRSIAYSTMQYAMFLIMKEIRGNGVEELSKNLSEKLKREDDDFITNKNFRLHQQNRYYMHQLMARITDYVEIQSGLPSRFTDYIAEGKNRYEIEHIWANHPDLHVDEFPHPADFAEFRNRIGGLLLLPKIFNGSYGDLPYDKKLDHYYGQNLLAQSLHVKCYEHNPGFLRLINEKGLPFKPIPVFTKQSIEDRQELYRMICERIWNPEHLVI